MKKKYVILGLVGTIIAGCILKKCVLKDEKPDEEIINQIRTNSKDRILD